MIKLITALHIQQWADTKESECMMPELIRRLIHSSVKGITRLSMPTGDSVSLSGFDGVLETSSGNAYISKGTTVFEIGTDKQVKKKADGDFNKRNGEITDEEKQGLNFIFITPRKWQNARKWERDNSINCKWKSLRVLTAVELEDWISLCPSVAIWLATKIGLLCDGINIDSPEGYWERWSVNAKGLHLAYGVLTGGREVNAKELIDDIIQPNVVSVVSGSTEESLAFAVASILEKENDSLTDRCVIAHDAQAIKELMTSYNDLVIITNSDVRSFGFGVVQNNDSIVYATNFIEQGQYGNIITLKSHDYHLFQAALEKSGLTEVEAKKAAKDSGRNIMILRHLLEFDLTNPSWTKRDDLAKVIPAMLLGRWSDDWEQNYCLLEELSGMKGEDIKPILQQWSTIDSSPFQKVNNVWCIASPYDTFLYIKGYLTNQFLDKFGVVLKKALADLDPNALEKINPNTAIYTFGKRVYSNIVREGLCLNLILIALQVDGGQKWVDTLVKEILEGSSKEWWLTYSNSDVVSYLAEASPKSFIEYIEKDICKDNSLMRELFVPIKKKSYWLGSYEVEYTQILFALEMLAWMPEYLLRVCLILMELDKIPNDSNYSNKPFNSLVDIFRLWFPKTSVDAEKRSKVLGAIFKKYPETGFRLCISLATDIMHQHVSFSSMISRWRLRDKVSVGAVSGYEAYVVLKKICELIESNCTPSANEALDILRIATDNTIAIELRKPLITHIANNAKHYSGNKEFYEQLMRMVNRFRNASPTYKWRISEEEIAILEEILNLVSPENTAERLAFLMDNHCYDLPEIHKISDYGKRYQKVLELRLNAVNQIVSEIGVDAFLEYALGLEEPSNAITSFAKREDGFSYFELIYGKLKENASKYAPYKDYFWQLAIVDKPQFIEATVKLKDDSFIWFPLSAADACDEIWAVVESLDDEKQQQYWQHTMLRFIPIDRVEYLISHFIDIDRWNEVIRILYHILRDEKEKLDVGYVVDVMKRTMKHLSGEMLNACSYELEEVMEWIDKNPDVSDEEIMALELPYIISQRDRMTDWRAYQIIIQNPKYLFELIDHAWFSDDEEEKKREMEAFSKNSQMGVFGQFSIIMLMEICTMPCTDAEGNIDSKNAEAYVRELIKMGKDHHKLSHVYHVIGHLFGSYKTVTSERPPEIICELIDEINDRTLNSSYHARVYNRLGSTVRGPFDGGCIEWNKSKTFAGIAESLEVEYPVTAGIYRSLADVYEEEAKRQDAEAEILKLDS